MRLLLDMPMSQRTLTWLRSQGHDAVHVRDLGLAHASDGEVIQRARQEGRLVLTMDLDFPRLLSILGATGPGVILIRLYRPHPQAIQRALQELFGTTSEEDLVRSIAVLEENRIRLHRLPIKS